MVLFLLSSLRPIEAMVRVDGMGRWLKEQSQYAQGLRTQSPSECLAVLWGKPNVPIVKTPDALRMLSESVLYEFRSERLEAMEKNPSQRASVNWEMTSPLFVRLGIADKEAEAAKSGSGQSFEGTSEFMALMGGDKQLARWDKSLELLERAHLESPLDWRLVWGRMLLDRKLPVSQWNGWYDRSGLLLRHRPETMFQLGLLGWHAAKEPERVYPLWRQSMLLGSWLAPNIASIIAMEIGDDEIPADIFPPHVYYLRHRGG